MPRVPKHAAIAVTLFSALTLSCKDETAPEVPGVASRIVAFSGENQVAAANTAIALAVKVTDDSNRPVPGAKVIWTLEVGGGTVTPESITDEHGIATAQRFLGSDAGDNRTRATLQFLNGPFVSFEAIAQVQGATQMQLAGGDGQSDTVFATLAPYQVLFRDHTGARVQGVQVRWQLLSQSGTLTAETSTSDANGVASIRHTLGRSLGLVRTEAHVDGLAGSPVRFTTSAGAGNVAAITATGGNDQIGVVGKELPILYTAFAVDAYGNPRNANLSWTVLSGGGTITDVSFGARHRLGPDEGLQSAAASVPGSALRVVFTSRAVSALVSVFQTFGSQPPRFLPSTDTIPAGRTVAWRWEGSDYCYYYYYYYYDCPSEQHNVTFEDDPSLPVSSPSQSTGYHLRTFNTAGRYRYRCTNHSTDFENGMVGSVVVN